MSHEAEIRKASGRLGGFIAMCQSCAWCPDIVHPDAQAAALAAAAHVLENRPTESP